MVKYSAALDRIAAAISDPTRRAILDRLAHGPARISDVAQPFPMTLTGFCKHVRVLERAGLVRRARRGRDNTLSLSPEPLRDVARWILNYEQFWNERLDRLHEFFAKDARSPGAGQKSDNKEPSNEPHRPHRKAHDSRIP